MTTWEEGKPPHPGPLLHKGVEESLIPPRRGLIMEENRFG
jgi:hypothetical protein